MVSRYKKNNGMTRDCLSKGVTVYGVRLTDADFALFWIFAQQASWAKFEIVQYMYTV